ncbi:MAG: hypothetical protein ACPW61_08265 [Methyloligella sp. ZOD6]
MTPHQSDRQRKRPRGRPKGTTKFEQQDLRLLGEFADLAISQPQTPLAPFLVGHGYEHKDVRRAQKRWRKEKAALLEEARVRADASPPDNLFEWMLYAGEMVAAMAGAVRPAMEKISGSLERAQRRVAAREKLGLDSDLPLDLTNQDAVERAIQRYGETVAKRRLPAEFDRLTLAELPFSLKLYVVAMLLHELSLQLAEAEKREGE